MAKYLEDLMYTATHEWVKFEGDKAKIGLSDFAQHHLGDIVFVNIPEVGDDVTAGEPCCDVESVKAVSDVFSPISGVICAVNEQLADNPALINEDCYGAWICEVENITAKEGLLDPAAYAELLEKEEAEEEAH